LEGRIHYEIANHEGTLLFIAGLEIKEHIKPALPVIL
jgi:hypothetical protein